MAGYRTLPTGPTMRLGVRSPEFDGVMVTLQLGLTGAGWRC